MVLVEGVVAERPEPGTDSTMASREVEVQVTALQLVGQASTPAIPVARNEGEELPAEELRLRHRVLDLRRPELQKNLLLRHRLLGMKRHERHHQRRGGIAAEKAVALGQDHLGPRLAGPQGRAQPCGSAADDQHVRLSCPQRTSRRELLVICARRFFQCWHNIPYAETGAGAVCFSWACCRKNRTAISCVCRALAVRSGSA